MVAAGGYEVADTGVTPMLSMLTAPVSPAFCTSARELLPAFRLTVTEVTAQSFQVEVGARLRAGPAAPPTRVDRLPVPPAALE